MWWRVAFPLVFILGPRLIPPVARRVYLVWKLTFDSRVPLLLRLLVPASMVISLPILRVPLAGPVGYVLVLLVAVWALFNLAPRHVVESYAPWRARGRTEERSKKDSSQVVEGRYHLVDDEEPTQ